MKRSNYVPYKRFRIIQELKQTFLKVPDHINFIFTFVNNMPNIETQKTLSCVLITKGDFIGNVL